MRLVFDTVSGMRHLETLRIVHGNLKAYARTCTACQLTARLRRTVLVTSGQVCKLSEIGYDFEAYGCACLPRLTRTLTCRYSRTAAAVDVATGHGRQAVAGSERRVGVWRGRVGDPDAGCHALCCLFAGNACSVLVTGSTVPESDIEASVTAGERLKRPSHVSDVVFRICQDCWSSLQLAKAPFALLAAMVDEAVSNTVAMAVTGLTRAASARHSQRCRPV